MKYLLLSLLILLPPAAFAESVRFRTLCPAADVADAGLTYLPSPEGEVVKIELPSANFSRERYLSSTREIRFFSGNPSPDSKPAAVARVPDGLRDAIIMLLPEGTPGRYHATVFDASLATFRGGDQRFLNLSRETVGIDLGGRKISVETGKSDTIRKVEADGPARLPLQMFRRSGETWDRFSATRVTIDSRIRCLVIIYPDPAEGRLRAKAIQDRVDQPG